MEEVDCVVIGAGVIGLAIARALALSGREVVILEAEDEFGTQTSSRNSEVIHAGISYRPGSLKATLCRQGRDRLYEYARERNINHQRIGKLIVAATEEETSELQTYLTLAQSNQVDDLQWLDQKQVVMLEPQVQAVAGVFSPSTGIIDSHGYMLSLLGDAENAGATIVYRSKVQSGEILQDGILLVVGGDFPITIKARQVINSAGLYAHEVAHRIIGMPAEHIPEVFYAIGHYYTLSGRSPFTHLVYPVARQAALRVHVTLDLVGECKFGPDIDWRTSFDYTFDQSIEQGFYEGIRRFWPALPDHSLVPGYTGIRPRLVGANALKNRDTDFVIQDQSVHGVKGLINLFGMESPGLTSSLAIGDYVRDMVVK